MFRLGSFSHAMLRILRKISAAPPRCSPNTRLGKMSREYGSGEQQGGAAEILSRNRVEHGEHTQSTHPRAVRGKRWTIRKSCGDKYAIECIFIDATLSDGRRLGYVS